jgi:NagD protein
MKSKNYIIDMDGVLVRGSTVIPGAQQFLERLQDCGCKFLILTNNPLLTPSDLAHRLNTIGLKVHDHQIYTSALATAQFLQRQKPNGKVFVIGESGLTSPLHNSGFIITDINPDYVVLGETNSYNFELLTFTKVG